MNEQDAVYIIAIMFGIFVAVLSYRADINQKMCTMELARYEMVTPTR